MNWKGIYAAMLTPLCPDGKVNTEEVRRLTEFLIEKGVHGLFPVSNVGGQIHLPLEEKCRFIEAVVEEAKGRAPVFPGISASNTKDAIQLGRYCESLGASGAVLSAPLLLSIPPGGGAGRAANCGGIPPASDYPLPHPALRKSHWPGYAP